MKAKSQLQKTAIIAAPKQQVVVPIQRSENERPDLSSQLDNATRLGHHLSAVNVHDRSSLVVQPKLTVGPVNDKYEQEADWVAQQVVNMTAPMQRQNTSNEDEEELQMKLLIQRMDALDEDEKVHMKPLIKRIVEGGYETGIDFESHLNNCKGSGAPLPTALRADFEPKFGADFSEVRIHADAQSDQLNQSIHAKAFTTGKDVFFRQGEYLPGSRGGQELIAHELSHVIQQTGRREPQRQLGKHNKVTGGKCVNFGFENSQTLSFWRSSRHLERSNSFARRYASDTVRPATVGPISSIKLTSLMVGDSIAQRNVTAIGKPPIRGYALPRNQLPGEGTFSSSVDWKVTRPHLTGWVVQKVMPEGETDYYEAWEFQNGRCQEAPSTYGHDTYQRAHCIDESEKTSFLIEGKVSFAKQRPLNLRRPNVRAAGFLYSGYDEPIYPDGVHPVEMGDANRKVFVSLGKKGGMDVYMVNDKHVGTVVFDWKTGKEPEPGANTGE